MRDFRDLVEVIDSDDYSVIRSRIEIGKYILSVQASKSHYSEPRANHESLHSYSKVEVAVRKGGAFVTNRSRCAVGRLLDSLPAFKYGGDQVYGWCKIEDVQELYEGMARLLT